MALYITQTALRCLQDIESWQAEFKGPEAAAAWVDAYLQQNVEAILAAPDRYRFNPLLADYGLMLRERLDQDHRLLYRQQGEHLYVLLVLHCKQDLVRALYRHQLMRG
ncbi:type II toxin-antitoxin system RelE/ParE family toxin [Alkalimonas delamerensis]|uniref:Type II toxin-antitoxin system RelE/ParE family toxin n=1 Tax=Alkalimonas delamerensis TaxID=265981 RepID=A0ABT9GQI2_9GAMM|nr:type II toxin-antitoxin system RelE/ParE family toxin [Alkalimonas delamerensis]MDP4529237.1 type II toxin-antitoxin system RelE/ParE family toxin [Alkalimonas delamerensis]